jgi:hypothetical protein
MQHFKAYDIAMPKKEKKFSYRTSDFCRLFKISKYTFSKWRREKKIDITDLEMVCKQYMEGINGRKEKV